MHLIIGISQRSSGPHIIIALLYLYFPQNNSISMQPPPQNRHKTFLTSPSQLKADNSFTHSLSPLPNSVTDHPSTTIQVYLRCPSKKAIKLHLPNEVSIQHIKREASDKMGIPVSQQILKLNGKEITHYTHVLLHPHSIVHITTRDALIRPEEITTLGVNIISSFQVKTPTQKAFVVSGEERVEDFLEKLQKELGTTLQTNGQVPFYFILQSSRLLDRKKTFSEQEVPRDAQLICLITKSELKTRFQNDTSEDILSDISALLQLDTLSGSSNQKSSNPIVSQHNPKDASSEGPEVYEVDTYGQDYQRKRRQSIMEQQQQQEENDTIAPFEHSNSFKKKPIEQPAPSQVKIYFLKAIRARRSKKELDEMLKRQGRDNIFYKEDADKSPKKESLQAKIAPIQQGKPQIQIHKPSAVIPKVMPVEQRKRIKLQMEKLFDSGDIIAHSSPSTSIQEHQPKSPPTEPPRIQKRREKMSQLRHTMGSRPKFLSQLLTTTKQEEI